MARESGRPVIWNALLAEDALNQHGSARMTPNAALDRLKHLNEVEGVRVYAQALTPTSPPNSPSRTTTCRRHPGLEGPLHRHDRGEDRDVQRPAAPGRRRGAARGTRRPVRVGYVLSEIKVGWIPLDVPNGLELQDKYEGYTIGEIAGREHKHPIDVPLDIAVWGELKSGFETSMMITPPESMKEIATTPMALPGVSDGGAHAKFVTTGRYPTELLDYWVREHNIMSLEEAHWRLSAPADPMFDRFWARVEEAGVTVTVHAGFDDGYREVDEAIARAWGLHNDTGAAHPIKRDEKDFSPKLIAMLQKKRLVHDFAAVLIAHGLFERFPRVRLAFIENGGLWVGPLLHDLQVTHVQNPGMFKRNPVDQFHENCWVAPFVEDNVCELAKHIPADRILFGSDWPHAEGVQAPRDFLGNLAGFASDDVDKIMGGNARSLTFA